MIPPKSRDLKKLVEKTLARKILYCPFRHCCYEVQHKLDIVFGHTKHLFLSAQKASQHFTEQNVSHPGMYISSWDYPSPILGPPEGEGESRAFPFPRIFFWLLHTFRKIDTMRIFACEPSMKRRA